MNSFRGITTSAYTTDHQPSLVRLSTFLKSKYIPLPPLPVTLNH